MKAICFIGMDGAGKTTQSKLLAKRLSALEFDVKMIHLFTSGNTVSSTVQEKFIFKRVTIKLRTLSTSGLQGVLKFITGIVCHFIDAWVTYIQHRLKYNNKIIIYDRYFYDQFAKFFSLFSWTFLKMHKVVKFLPKADVTYLIKVPIEIAYSRKQEDSILRLQKCEAFYEAMLHLFDIELIDGTQDIDSIADKVFQKCLTKIG